MQIAEFIFHFPPAEEHTVSVIRKNNNNKRKNNLTIIYKDSHLDLAFL